MKTFYKWLENINNSLVSINLEPYRKSALKKAHELLDFVKDRNNKLSKFQLDVDLIKSGLKDFPMLPQLLNSLSKDPNQNKWLNLVSDWFEKIRKELDLKQKNEINQLKQSGVSSQEITKTIQKHREQGVDLWNSIYGAIRHLNDYYDSKESKQINEKEYQDLVDKAVEETNKNMLDLKYKIEQAVANLEWSGSKITIVPDMPESQEEPVPSTDSAHVVVGKEALFSYFNLSNNKFEIDDIIEDDDFFQSNEEKQDYYNLINQLQNPNQKEQILTLYTARPAKDKEFYDKTTYLPAGVFLTNSFSHADGLAGDLAGSEERRDIYKVKINSKYLVKTLDGPVKYYQAIKDAPVESINLY